MTSHTHFLRQLLVALRLQQARRAVPFTELQAYLLEQTAVGDMTDSYTLRTFQRDVPRIAELLGVTIGYDRRQRGYVATGADLLPPGYQRLLEAFELQEFFRLPAALAPFVQLERRRALGLEHLRPLLRAAQQRQWVRFDYRKFWEDASALRCFGLDRVQRLEMMPRYFTPPPDFNAQSYYQHSFGIIRPDNEEPQRVVLSLEPDQGQYVKSYPLHQSQRVLVDTDAELRVELTVYTTHDLLMELLSMGERVQVLEPKELQQQIRTVYEQGLVLASSAAVVPDAALGRVDGHTAAEVRK